VSAVWTLLPIYLAAHTLTSRVYACTYTSLRIIRTYTAASRAVCVHVYAFTGTRCLGARVYVRTYSCMRASARAYTDTIFSSCDSSNISDVDVSGLPISLSLSLSLSLSISHTVGEIVSNRNEFSVNDREDSRMKSSVTRALVRLSSFTAIIDKRVSIFQSTLAQRARPDLIVLIDLTWRDTRLYLVLAARISTNESLPFEFRIEDSSNHVRNMCNWDGALLSNDRARRNVLAWDVLLLWRLRTTGTSRGSFLLKARLGLYDRESRSKPLRALWKLLAATRCFAGITRHRKVCLHPLDSEGRYRRYSMYD